MNENYNGIDNLDYTIDLDGDTYNITAADSAWADIARKVENILTINQSTLDVDENGTPVVAAVEYDGDTPKEISVVPSTGGTFTGPVSVPNFTKDNQDDSYVMNRASIEDLIAQIKGFPTYTWSEENGLEAVNNPDDSTTLSAFKVVIYNDENYPNLSATENKYGPPISFEAQGALLDCYFLTINKYNGWIAVCHQYSNLTDNPATDGDNINPNYQWLWVEKANNANKAAFADKAGTSEYASKWGNATNFATLTDFKDVQTRLGNLENTLADYDTLKNHTEVAEIHRRIFNGTADPTVEEDKTAFDKATEGAQVNDIYIKYS